MARAKLTRRTVEAAVTTGKTYVVYDTELAGFGLRVTAAGSKAWIVEYRPGAGGRRVQKRRFSFGSASVHTPDEARRTARDLLQKIGQGFDPLSARSAERASLSFSEASALFIAEHVTTKRKGTTAAAYEDLLARLVEPSLGSKKLAAISRADLARLHNGLRGKPATANKMLAVVGSLFGWAMKHGHVDEGPNPASRIEKFPERSRERFLSVAELERLGTTLEAAETVGLPWTVDLAGPKAKHLASEEKRRTILSPFATAAVRLLILTGCRLREILNLRWAEVDFERGMLHLPDSKTGRKSVILNAPAQAVIDALPRAGEFVIAGNAVDKPRADLKKPWSAICEHAGLKGLRIHDLRHSFASVGAGAGMGLPIVGKLLGHTQAATTARYAHLDADPLRKASNAIGATINAAMKGKRAAPAVELHARQRKSAK